MGTCHEELAAAMPSIRRVALHRAGRRWGVVDADDMAQAGALKALEKAAGYDPARGASLRSYLVNIAYYGMSDALRDNDYLSRREREQYPGGAVRHLGALADDREDAAPGDRLTPELLAALTEEDCPSARPVMTLWDATRPARLALCWKHRVMLALVFVEGWTQRDAAAVWGSSQCSASATFRRALGWMREYYAADPDRLPF